MIHPRVGSISDQAQGGIQEEDGHLNKIRILFGMRKGQWEWMLSWQLSVYDTHLLGSKLPENKGCIFSYYCIPSM